MDTYSFKLTNAEKSYVVLVRFNKKASFMLVTDEFKRLQLKNSVATLNNMMNNITRSNTVRPLPAQGVPVVKPLTIDGLRARDICQAAQDVAGDKCFQFFRIIIMFDNIYNKDQTCCCCCGFSSYDIYKTVEPMLTVMRDALTAQLGNIICQHSVFHVSDEAEFLKYHGQVVANALL